MPFDPREPDPLRGATHGASPGGLPAATLTREACSFAPPRLGTEVPSRFRGLEQAAIAKVLLNFAHCNEPIERAGTFPGSFEATVQRWLHRHLDVRYTEEHYVVVYANPESAMTEYGFDCPGLGPGLPMLAWEFVHDNAVANVVCIEEGARRMEQIEPGLAASVLYEIDRLSREPYYCWTLADFFRQQVWGWWEGETTDEGVRRVLRESQGIAESDFENAIMPAMFAKQAPQWAYDPSSTEAARLPLHRITRLARRTGWVGKLGRLLLRARTVQDKRSRQEGATALWKYHEGSPPFLHAYFLRWNDRDLFDRLFDDLQNERANSGDSTETSCATQVPLDLTAFRRWKASMESCFMRASMLDELIRSLATTEERNECSMS